MNRFWEALAQWRDRPARTDAQTPLTGGRRYLFLLLHNFWSLLGLGGLTVLLCVPVVTMPAALSGLSRVCFELSRSGNCIYPFSTFRTEFRQDFGRRLMLGLPLLLLPLLLGVLGAAAAGPAVGAGLLLSGLCLACPVECFLYVLFAAAALPVSVNGKNAVILALTAGLSKNLPLMLLTAAPLLICWLLFPYSLPLLPALPGCSALAVCQLVLPILQETVLTDGDAECKL